MIDPVTEIFGYILVGVGLLLAVREQVEFSRRKITGSWFVTPHRYRRRLVVSVILALIGSLFVFHARALIPMRVGTYVIYVFVLMGLSLLLMVLVIVDVMETARNAAKHSLTDLQRAIDEQRRLRQEAAQPDESADKWPT
jgi:heme exporter protein D